MTSMTSSYTHRSCRTRDFFGTSCALHQTVRNVNDLHNIHVASSNIILLVSIVLEHHVNLRFGQAAFIYRVTDHDLEPDEAYSSTNHAGIRGSQTVSAINKQALGLGVRPPLISPSSALKTLTIPLSLDLAPVNGSRKTWSTQI